MEDLENEIYDVLLLFLRCKSRETSWEEAGARTSTPNLSGAQAR